jgi:glycosyltransferase involved in cell wall biosynthesis
MKKITILTESIKNNLVEQIYKELIIIKRKLLRKTNPPSNRKIIISTGPDTVLKSLINGFNRLNVKYNLNPKKTQQMGDTVVVLSNIEALRQAIELKKNKKINKLLAGPNLVVLPSENKDLICSRYIDTYLVNSEWTKKMYIKDASELKNRIVIWPAGVDANCWKPGKKKKEYVLVYIKSAPKNIVKNVINLLKKNNLMVKIIRYGEYKPDKYLRFLQKSKFAVFFSGSESQGIALFEAWSCNVPTLVWNKGDIIISLFEKEKSVPASSAPYLTEKTGLFFKNTSEFKTALEKFRKKIEKYFFQPREYILQNFTDKLSAKNLLDIMQKS